LEGLFPETRGRACRLLHIQPTAYSPSWEELLTICQIATGVSAERIFEFGTFDGRTTIHLALNTPDHALIHSLDIQSGEFDFGANAGLLRRCRVGEHVFDSPWAGKVQFIAGDSRVYDLSKFDGAIDLVFIDADHSYEGVMNDSSRAFRMIKPGGTIIWHDYLMIDEVTRALIELGRSRPLANIAGTSLVVWRDIDGARPASAE